MAREVDVKIRAVGDFEILEPDNTLAVGHLKDEGLTFALVEAIDPAELSTGQQDRLRGLGENPSRRAEGVDCGQTDGSDDRQ